MHQAFTTTAPHHRSARFTQILRKTEDGERPILEWPEHSSSSRANVVFEKGHERLLDEEKDTASLQEIADRTLA